MSRKGDYINALSVAVLKDDSVGSNLAVLVLEAAYALPEESFPPVRAADVRLFVEYASSEGDAPEWVTAAKQNAKANASLVRVRCAERGTVSASETWWENATSLWGPEDTPMSTHKLFPPGLLDEVVSVPREDYDALLVWAKTIPGAWDDEQPFEVVNDEEEPFDG